MVSGAPAASASVTVSARAPVSGSECGFHTGSVSQPRSPSAYEPRRCREYEFWWFSSELSSAARRAAVSWMKRSPSRASYSGDQGVRATAASGLLGVGLDFWQADSADSADRARTR